MQEGVAIIFTYNVAGGRYSAGMPKPTAPINQWVRDALAHAGMSQAEMARRLTDRLRREVDRSIVNKMTISRGVEADELFAIADITGFPAPNDQSPGINIPLFAGISAGALARDSAADEALGTIHVCDLPQGDWIALKVQGDSMDRISPPDSVIFVDRSDKRLVPNGLYVIDDGEGNATYKRYRPGPPPRFEPVSVNPSLEPIFFENEPTIVGRVKRSQIDT